MSTTIKRGKVPHWGRYDSGPKDGYIISRSSEFGSQEIYITSDTDIEDIYWALHQFIIENRTPEKKEEEKDEKS